MKPRYSALSALCAVLMAMAALLLPGTAHAATAFHLQEAEQHNCLDIRTQDGATTDGARLQRFTCHNVPEQFWEPIQVGSGAYLLRNPRSQMCVAVDSADFGAQVVQHPCVDGNRGELWIPNGPFVQRSGFVNLHSGLAAGNCLDTLGQFVKVFPCSSSQNNAQLWELI